LTDGWIGVGCEKRFRETCCDMLRKYASCGYTHDMEPTKTVIELPASRICSGHTILDENGKRMTVDRIETWGAMNPAIRFVSGDGQQRIVSHFCDLVEIER